MSEGIKEIRLGLFMRPVGHHIAGWRHPNSAADQSLTLPHLTDLALTAETAGFDFLFLADSLGLRQADRIQLSRTARYVSQFEPLTLLAALSGSTENIGLIATVSTSYNEPYHIARKVASLDHLSNGRSGCNLVTSYYDHEAANFGDASLADHATRYERADEFARVLMKLWDSWEDNAFIYDKVGGVYFDPEKLHDTDHRGKHFRVQGPLNIARPPQHRPVIVLSGGSPAAVSLAGQCSDIVFTAQSGIDGGRLFYREIKDSALAAGRDPDRIKIMPGLMPIVGTSRSEAEEKLAELQSLVAPEVAISLLAELLGGMDLSHYPLDGPPPEPTATNASKSRPQLLLESSRAAGFTLRQLALHTSLARGHLLAVGTPADIVDVMVEWVDTLAADGFNVMPAHFPDGLTDFARLVIPELYKRNRLAAKQEGRTLREKLSLDPHACT
ncbi:LLM class flavin-dependent oxidoreductase [Sinorhizobium sp. 8-89]|uniref:LLM class flavin-dependent oxidoreductase n=1 Tax=Sinorhizobium sp. 7-81 TaxID=3049087 RepID=UPI0024C39C74|nr:LLM class flavin-dependent oxidoreductase [Sinorhizobium sp. 7-81]MDK1389504.1 LLM class flavin-dependent oxidoreductase [Sinorhizobium sp. 7-81]